jgi:EAL domain-containing protein (putative c-di-GMP-specific phosphodiesterase class I)
MAVNLSARQFQQTSVADVVAAALRTSGLDAELLELELTESLALQDAAAIGDTLNDLKAIGVGCSIDDFGTGYSGLNYLTRFPIDRLKIDKFFVRAISDGGDDARIVSAVIALAHSLRLEVIAEGVETEEQAEFLRAHGCDQMQGYLFSRPVAADEFGELLRARASLPDAHESRGGTVLRVHPGGAVVTGDGRTRASAAAATRRRA